MRPSWSYFILLGLLGPLAGCQLTGIENPNAPANLNGSGSGTPNHNELSPKKTAEVCLVTAEALEKAVEESEANGQALEKAGQEKEAKVQYEKAHKTELEAIALYEKARQNSAQKPLGRKLAVLYDHLGEYQRAMEEYQKLLKHSLKDADLLNDVGYCFYNQGKWGEAEKNLRQALAVNPKLERAWINLGMTLAQQNRIEESLEAFAKVVSPAQAQCNLAFIWTTQGKREEAKAAYRKALTLEPNLAPARAFLAKLEHPAAPRSPAPAPVAAPPLEYRAVEREIIEDQTPIVVP